MRRPKIQRVIREMDTVDKQSALPHGKSASDCLSIGNLPTQAAHCSLYCDTKKSSNVYVCVWFGGEEEVIRKNGFITTVKVMETLFS